MPCAIGHVALLQQEEDVLCTTGPVDCTADGAANVDDDNGGKASAGVKQAADEQGSGPLDDNDDAPCTGAHDDVEPKSSAEGPVVVAVTATAAVVRTRWDGHRLRTS